MLLSRARALALALPGTVEAPHHEATSFRVRGKIFATAPPAGDRLHVLLDGEDLETALEAGAEVVEELRWGKKVVGVRVHLARAGVPFVRDLLRRAWRTKAPRTLAEEASPRKPRRR